MPKAAGEEDGGRSNSAPPIWIRILPLMFSSRVTMARAPHLSEPGVLSRSPRPPGEPQSTGRRCVRTGCVADPSRGARAARCPGFRGCALRAPGRLLREGAALRPPFLVLPPGLRRAWGGGGPVLRARKENRGFAPPLGESMLRLLWSEVGPRERLWLPQVVGNVGGRGKWGFSSGQVFTPPSAFTCC